MFKLINIIISIINIFLILNNSILGYEVTHSPFL
ncbi:hypothetical protein VPHD528_0212 [Vibrio phage D528]